MNKKSYVLRWALVVAGLLVVCFSYYPYQAFFTENIQARKANAYLYIPKGATFQTVLDSMEKNKMFEDKMAFAFVAKIMSYQDHVKPGRYLLKANSNNLDVIRILRAGKEEPLKITFTNIRLKEDLAERMDGKMSFTAAELMALLNDENYLKPYGFNKENVMVMFIPNTYKVYWTTTAKGFFERMNFEYKQFWTAERKMKADSAGLTPIQVSILASIIETETNRNSEKPRMAGVYINRLNCGMPLQADPTLKFALKDFGIKRILHEHIEVESPYNTYKYTGLPPGPVYLPSIPSIDAVLNYEKNKYLFFVASPGGNGHIFTETYRDHVNTANKYRKHLDQKGY
jgi:UPF0755 protein